VNALAFGCWTLAAALGTTLASSPLALGQTQTSAEVPAGELEAAASVPAALARRLIHAFTFEEAERAPVQMPPGFYRYIATDQGFPPYGEMKLSKAAAATGNWSFEFSLDTGSLAARVPTAVIPVLPLADYSITAMIRTDGLVESRARLVAWFNDADGNAIPDSRMQTDPIATAGGWLNITIPMVGQFERAVDLSIELQLVQPRHYRRLVDSAEPKIEDVAGKAWFDDVCIWQVPRIELATSSPVNVVVPPQRGALTILVQDLTSESLTGHLEITDIDGNVVMRRVVPSANDPRPTEIDISSLPYGWYSAAFQLKRDGNLLTQRQLEFLIAPQPLSQDLRRATRFAVDLHTADVAQHHEQTAELLQHIGCDAAGVPIWTSALIAETSKVWADHLRTFVDQLLIRHVEPTFVLPEVPRALAQLAQVDTSQVMELLRRDSTFWRPYLDDLIITFGLQISRWQLGARTADEIGWRAEPHRVLRETTSALKQLIAGPSIYVPWPAVEQLPPDFTPGGLAIEAPYHLPASSLLEYAERWRTAGVETSIALEPLPRDAFSPRQRLADFAQRMLYAWRADFSELAVQSPWTIEGLHRPVVQPDVVYIAFQRLASELARMEFVAELELDDTIDAWLLRDPVYNTGTIVAWSARAGAQPVTLRALFADGPIKARDLFGNEKRIELAAVADMMHPVHSVQLSDLPTFLHGTSLGLAQFRAGFAFLPNFLEAEHRLHEHELVMTNPWEFTITGTLHLAPPENWRITPRTHEIVLSPGQQLRVPIDVVLDRSVLGGRKQLDVDVRLVADREYEFTQRVDLEVGLREIDFSAHWSLVPNESTGAVDLIISQYVTNRGDRPLNLSTYVTAPGLSQRRRMIGGLEPGQTIVRHFRIERGAEIMAGKIIHVGLAEQDGSARLRKALEIPSQSKEPMTAHAEDE
jgi:hypothetical protein